MISRALLQTVLQQYRLPPDGVHGVAHWARLVENGNRIAQYTHANIEIVQLFAILHDSQRQSERVDPEHGRRGAEYARFLRETARFSLTDNDFALLYDACAYHADGLTQGDLTVQTCWDADRLDLGRADITPDPQKLCTTAAKNPDLLAWADQRARSFFVPEFVRTEWGIYG